MMLLLLVARVAVVRVKRPSPVNHNGLAAAATVQGTPRPRPKRGSRVRIDPSAERCLQHHRY